MFAIVGIMPTIAHQHFEKSMNPLSRAVPSTSCTAQVASMGWNMGVDSWPIKLQIYQYDRTIAGGLPLRGGE
jgi:hypothetical protein